ncbi:hypothetical protein F9L03_26425, partial [Brucella lupini]
HARQEQVWEAIKDAWSKEPYQIRRMLTETTVRASDKRAVFVGDGERHELVERHAVLGIDVEQAGRNGREAQALLDHLNGHE